MNRVISFFRSTAEVSILGVKKERIINLCAENEIIFWDPQIGESSFSITIYARDIKKLVKLFPAAEIKKRGLTDTIAKLKKRWWLIFAASFCIIFFWTISHFVWSIEVYGNESVPTYQILRVLEEQGVTLGTFGLTVNSEALANHMLYEIPELSWFAVNIKGSRARVLVRERVQPPEVLDEEAPMAIYAEKNGIILEINVLNGTRQYNVGDTVQKGELLVSGVMGSPTGGARTEHATALVKARTWYEYTASMPRETLLKTYTGEETVKFSALVVGKLINIYSDGSSPFAYSDRDTTEKTATLPGGGVLPFTLIKTRFREYVTETIEMDVKECADILEKELSQRLRDDLGEGEIITADFEVTEQGGVVTVTLRAECRERIDETRPMTDAEIADGTEQVTKEPEW